MFSNVRASVQKALGLLGLGFVVASIMFHNLNLPLNAEATGNAAFFIFVVVIVLR